jgi:hypothetical protein
MQFTLGNPVMLVQHAVPNRSYPTVFDRTFSSRRFTVASEYLVSTAETTMQPPTFESLTSCRPLSIVDCDSPLDFCWRGS